MSYLSESTNWESEIYRIQVYDPINGGSDGIVNIQPRQIANRTNWLLGHYGTEHAIGEDHSITDEMVEDDAAIAGSKTTVSTSFSEIEELLATLNTDMLTFSDAVGDIAGTDGMRVITIAKALQTLWTNTSYPFAFEYFDTTLNMRKNITEYALVDVVSTVSGDDTVIVESTEGMSVGDNFLVVDADRVNAEVVTVSEILTDTRFLATEPLSISRTSGYVLRCAWTYDNAAPATAHAGGWYLSAPMKTLIQASNGMFVVNKESDNGQLSVFITSPNDDGTPGDWTEIGLSNSETKTDGTVCDYYYVPLSFTGKTLVFLVKNETDESIIVNHLALATIPTAYSELIIRKPEVLDPEDGATLWADDVTFLASKYFNIYRDPFDHTEFLFTDTTDGTTYTINIPTEDPQSMKVDVSGAIPEGVYTVACRHVSDMGDVSKWSDTVTIYLQAVGTFFGFEGASHSDRLLDASDDTDEVAVFRSLDYEQVRFGFMGTQHTEGFDLAMFATASQLDDSSE